MILSCKEATELASRSVDQDLTWPQRIALRLHLLICHRCRHYVKHLRFLKQLATKIDQHIEMGSTALSPQAKQNIRDRLQQESRSG